MLKYEILINRIDEDFKAQCKIGDKCFEILNNIVIQTKPYVKDWRSEASQKELEILINILEFNKID